VAHGSGRENPGHCVDGRLAHGIPVRSVLSEPRFDFGAASATHGKHPMSNSARQRNEGFFTISVGLTDHSLSRGCSEKLGGSMGSHLACPSVAPCARHHRLRSRSLGSGKKQLVTVGIVDLDHVVTPPGGPTGNRALDDFTTKLGKPIPGQLDE